jgi:hypothetical protein
MKPFRIGRIARITIAMIGLAQAGLATPALAFSEGDVFWAPGGCGTPCGIFDITDGGGIVAGDIVATTSGSPGQIAWSTDLQTLYMTEFGSNQVVSISNAGAVGVFATGVSGPTGLLRLSDGRLFVVSYNDGTVLDISAGGDFSAATPFATGFDSPRNLIQLSNGSLLLADQGSHLVYDITTGGDYSSSAGFASGFTRGPYDLAQDDLGKVYASTRGPVYDITNGGDFSAASGFATGIEFMGLTIDGDQRLLASEFSEGSVFDISAGGDFFAATPFADSIPGFADTTLDALPSASTPPPPPPPVPGLGAVGGTLLGLGLVFAATRRRD